MNGKDKTFDGRFWLIFTAFIFIVAFILWLPYLITSRSWFGLDFKGTGEVGDTIGGIMGPFIAIGAAILTFLAFWVQYKANEQQKKDLKIERFENKFYELLRLHKANVDEINIGDRVFGRKAFVPMFYELRYCYLIAEDFIKSTSPEVKADSEYDQINLISFAFRIFFFGIGLHSEKHFVVGFNKGEAHLFNQIKPFFEKSQDSYLEYMKANHSAKYYTHGLPTNEIPNEFTIEFYYYPFDGHVNKLGHYFRHLFQTVNFVLEQTFIEDKYGYIKMLRAQLSNFEQLLLYYNALAWFDSEWKEIFTEYRFIKNLPIPLADFDVLPEKHFEKEIAALEARGIAMFEWHE